jgi:AcrR family transcriptional regulator
MDTALEVFGERGYESATISEIVRRAGYSKGAFYTHFGSKEELFFHLLERRVARNRSRFHEICRWRGDAAAWTERVFGALLGFSQSDASWRALAIEFMAHGMRDPRVGQRIGRMHREWRELIAEPLRSSDAWREGRMAADPGDVAACVVAMVDGVILQASMEPDGPTMQDLAERMMPLLDAWFTSADETEE